MRMMPGYTPYHAGRRYAEQTGTPMLTVSGVGHPKGKPCTGFSEHGFVGMEARTIKAMLSWIRAGAVPGDVSD